MLLNGEGLCPDICLLADGEKIEQVSSLKFLGMVLDVQLNFEGHYNSLYDKLCKASFVIRKVSSFLPTSCTRNLTTLTYLLCTDILPNVIN